MPREIKDFTGDFENFLTVTDESRNQAARDRDYVDHKQWTDDEISKLAARGQSPIVINRTKVKVNFLTGAERSGRTDPKALPRTPDHEDAADAATKGLRFVADNTDLDQTASASFEDYIVWGTEAAITEVSEKGDDFEIAINGIAGDRFYYDPHSRKLDFSDAKYMGISIWMDQDDAVAQFPKKKDDIESVLTSSSDSVDGSTFDDQPKWLDRKRKRIRVCRHYYKENGVWHLAYFTDSLFLMEPRPSPLLDEFEEPINPIEAQSAYIDREGNRYGEVRGYIWVQDEINHRRSKFLYMISVRQTVGDKGAVDDINVAKSELAKANGHVETVPGKRFELLENSDVNSSQFLLYQDGKSELDSIGANSALSGEPDTQLSGRAITALQQGGLTELAGLFDGHRAWKQRIYRQVWNRIRQFWDQEKWIRVTDDQSDLQWVGLNQPITLGQKLQESAQQGDERAQAALQQLIDDPRLNEVVEVRNNVAELDVDIELSESKDIVTIRQEQFDTLAQLAQAYGPQEVPFEAMLRLSDMTDKEDVLELLKPEEQDQEQVQAQVELQSIEAESELNNKNADTAAKAAKAAKDQADADAQNIENEVVAQQLGIVNGAA